MGPVNPSPRLRLRLKAGAETAVRSGHPWIFSESIRECNREGHTGELAIVYDRRDRFLAAGLFDATSPIRVRVLQSGKRQVIDERWWRARLEKALDRRAGLLDDATTGCRLIHGESDGWPGLVLDRYDRTLVLKLYTPAWLPRLGELTALFQSTIQCERIMLRLSRNFQRMPTGVREGPIYGAGLHGSVLFMESGLRFEADVVKGQKTGFFLDQRENRRLIQSLAAGRRVLNAFSFSGAFSLYSAAGGAAGATDLDISAHALDSARRSFGLNRANPAVAACRHKTEQADALKWLEASRTDFDLVILDPPSFAKRASEQESALGAYAWLAALGIRRLAAGGILAAASCSAHVPAAQFFETVRSAAKRAGRKHSEIKVTGHPIDHPATFKEAEYLKMIYLKFGY